MTAILTPRRATLLAVVSLLLAATLTVVAGFGGRARAAGEPYRDPSLPVATRVSDLLSRMTLDEKIGQMTQADRAALTNSGDIATFRLGSILSGGGSAPANNSAAGWADMYDGFQNTALTTPLGIPIIYGIDAVHGHNNVRGATIFPHNIGLGASRDADLVQRIGRATAEEVSGTGIDWTFAPCLCVARNDRWGRTYESFGEVPEIGTALTTIITGLQGSTLNGPSSILATAKHYVGDGGTTNGTDQGNTQISEADLRAIHLPPFRAAVQRGVGSVMISFSSWNGQKMHGNRFLITDVLKGELGFTGFVVTDWAAVDQLDGQLGFTGAEIATAINAGVDMVMVPTDYRTFISLLRTEVQANRVPMTRIDDANRRILTKKFELGLFERPRTDRTFTSTVGNAAHRTLAREAVRKSVVLLRNTNNVLPLAKTGGKIFVAGKSADDIGNQSGGWTISWQGASGNTTTGTTILQGIRAAVGSGTTVTFNRDGVGVDNTYRAAIAVVGETPYAEGMGDRPGTMSPDAADTNTINRLRAAGIPVIVVLVSGRPMDISAQLPNWNALLAAWLPGTEGAGVADVLFGDYNPTAKLPVTWMQTASQEPINSGDGKTPLWALGFGLNYGGVPPTTPPVTTPPATTPPATTPPATTPPATTPAATTPAATTPAATTPARTTPPATTPAGGLSCRVTYRVLNQWPTGFTVDVNIAVLSGSVNGWTLTYSYSGNQQITNAWNAVVTQTGAQVSARDAGYNAAIAAGANTSWGYNASFSGTNANPSAFALNGVACQTG